MYQSSSAWGQSGSGEEALAIGIIIAVAAVVFLIALAINVVLCLLLQSCFKPIPAEHRKMSPGQVWLLLIPLFNIVWNFFVYLRLPESYKSFFDAQGRTDVGDCGRSIGLWFAICAACSVVPCVNYIAGPAALVLLIIFMVKAFDLKKKVLETTSTPATV